MRNYEVYYNVNTDELTIYKKGGNLSNKPVDIIEGKYGIELSCNIYEDPLKMTIYDATTTLGFTKDLLLSFSCDKK